MHAGIIAGGEGTRLRSYFPGIPKLMIPIQGVPLIESLIYVLESVGFSKISIIMREDHQQIAEYINQLTINVQINIVHKNTSGGMHSLFTLQPFLEKESEFYLFKVDNVFDPLELDKFVKVSKNFNNQTLTTWVTHRFNDFEEQVGIELDNKFRVLDFGKHLIQTVMISEGPYYCRPNIFKEREKAESLSIERLSDYIRLLLHHNHIIYGYYVPKVFDIDDQFSYQQALDFLSQLQNRWPSKSKNSSSNLPF
jgi:NDP-sugar pyrophosphorylase family protein